MPAVDLGDRALGVVGVLLLDDRDDRAVGVADDAAVARGVGEVAVTTRDGAAGRVVRRDEALERLAVEQRHVAVRDDHGAGQVGGQRLEGALDGAAGALDVVLVGDDAPRGRPARTCSATRSRSWRTTTARCCGLVPRAARIAWPTRVRPPIVCRTLGVVDFMRVPSPAARTITAVGRRSLTGRSSFGGSGCTRVRATPADVGAGVRLGHATRGAGVAVPPGRTVSPSTSSAPRARRWRARMPPSGPRRPRGPRSACDCSPGRSRTCVACPDSKSGGPCRQTNRGSSRDEHRVVQRRGRSGAGRSGGARRRGGRRATRGIGRRCDRAGRSSGRGRGRGGCRVDRSDCRGRCRIGRSRRRRVGSRRSRLGCRLDRSHRRRLAGGGPAGAGGGAAAAGSTGAGAGAGDGHERGRRRRGRRRGCVLGSGRRVGSRPGPGADRRRVGRGRGGCSRGPSRRHRGRSGARRGGGVHRDG